MRLSWTRKQGSAFARFPPLSAGAPRWRFFYFNRLAQQAFFLSKRLSAVQICFIFLTIIKFAPEICLPFVFKWAGLCKIEYGINFKGNGWETDYDKKEK
ncbi:hypothetical protein DRW41_03080 [Neobacillus piezotolerans]|uniref:Uncharacterized protein n=1 Tax=Neobacillus piezotolerans TaxID=2259171 RepID=A0A3D8GVR5_9BACI|nr:hypothetical protein DRW41_03080 [Neobacillus piezotolerans]